MISASISGAELMNCGLTETQLLMQVPFNNPNSGSECGEDKRKISEGILVGEK
jgi:hypothetical protein